MNILCLLLEFSAIILNHANFGKFIPSVAFHDNLPAMYKTDKGWVVNETVTNKLTNHSDIVKFCQNTYPNLKIINAAPLFSKEVITNWCKLKQLCTAQDKFEIHPIECLNASHSYRPFNIPSNCKINMDQNTGCLEFHVWKRNANKKCNGNDQSLRDMQVLFPCRGKFMLFQEVEYICCPNRDGLTLYSPNLRSKLNDINMNYASVFEHYQNNASLHSEHSLFSKTKRALNQTYHTSLNLLNKETTDNLVTIIKKKDDKPNSDYKNEVERLFNTYKHNHEAITRKFTKELYNLDTIHIRRIIRRSDKICHYKNNTDHEMSQCLQEMDKVSKKIIQHFGKILHFRDIDHQEYSKFIESRLKHFYSKYLPLVNNDKVWSKKFHEQLEKYCSKLKSSFNSTNKRTVLEVFKRLKDNAALFIHNQEHYLSLAPMVAIIAVVIVVLVLIVSIAAYKYNGGLCRRGSHNYMMRVVADPNHSTQSINRPEVKLNLYENPIFNSKPASKPIEKQALIENMEN